MDPRYINVLLTTIGASFENSLLFVNTEIPVAFRQPWATGVNAVFQQHFPGPYVLTLVDDGETVVLKPVFENKNELLLFTIKYGHVGC